MLPNKTLQVVRRCITGQLCAAEESLASTKPSCCPRLPHGRAKVPCRTYLPATYNFRDVWRSRLSGGLLSKLRHEEFYVELRKRLDAGRDVSAVDMDIFANLVEDRQTLGLLLELLPMLRKTATAPRLLAGTHFAVVQACMDFNESAKLISVIREREKYGIFLTLDNASMTMDQFLVRNDYLNACRIAVELMLQEDFGMHALSRSLALLSCLKYFDSVVPVASEVNKPTETAGKDVGKAAASAAAALEETLYPALPKVTEAEDEEADEMLIYVHFIKDPFFDDHFDLRKTRKLCGKTLYMAAVSGLKPESARELPYATSEQNSALDRTLQHVPVRLPRNSEDEALLNSCAILGLIMYRKLAELKKFLDLAQPTAVPTSNGLNRDTKTAELPHAAVPDAASSPKIPVANDLIKKVEQFFAVSTAAPHTADVADDQLHVMERPSDRHENLCKEPELNVTEQSLILAQLQQYTNPVSEIAMTAAAEKLVNDMVKIYENIDVPLRKQQIVRWMKLREDNVAQEIKKHEIETRLQAITARRVQLGDEEDVLFFFERKSDWERMLDAQALKQIKDTEDAEGAPYDYRVQEPGYEENQTPAATRAALVKPYKDMQDAFDRKKQKLDLESGRLTLNRGGAVAPIVGKKLGKL